MSDDQTSTPLQLAYLIALLTDAQRWELAHAHAALLQEHGRFIAIDEVHRLYAALAERIQDDAALTDAVQRARQRGES